jgi:hypothetical protein
LFDLALVSSAEILSPSLPRPVVLVGCSRQEDSGRASEDGSRGHYGLCVYRLLSSTFEALAYPFYLYRFSFFSQSSRSKLPKKTRLRQEPLPSTSSVRFVCFSTSLLGRTRTCRVELTPAVSFPSSMLQLSYVRMSTPVRSKICDHLQCFEASSWFQINEQTPQWACPVCERVLTIDQLFVDGSVPPSSRSTCSFSFDVLTLCFSRFFSYTDGIIKDCPDSVDDATGTRPTRSTARLPGSPRIRLVLLPFQSSRSRRPTTMEKTGTPSRQPSLL